MQAKKGGRRRKVIAFDLDDTLIPCEWDFPTERPRSWARLFLRERLRKHAARLMRGLSGRGWDVWVYTTSFRSPAYIKVFFLLHGVRLRGVVNQERHHRVVSRSRQPHRICSKYPPAFGIDVLVDESEGVEVESRRYGFPVLRVRPDDDRWADRLLDDLDILAANGLLPCDPSD